MRNKNWKKTAYPDRKIDWQIHDLIIEKLTSFEGYRKASQEEDYNGIDYWKGKIPFDLKVTDHLPKTFEGDRHNSYKFYQDYLCYQDLSRASLTNRVIVLMYKDKIECTAEDAHIIAFYIRDALPSDYLYNVPYVFWGPRDNSQRDHPRYGECHTMEVGLLIHYM